MEITTISFLFLSLIFITSTVLYKYNYTEYARYSALLGFGSLFIVSIVLTIVFTLNNTFHVWFFGVNMGILLMFNAFTRVWYKDTISYKLTKMATLFILFIMPFYIMPSIRPILQELVAQDFHMYLQLLNIDSSLMYQEPNLLTRIVFDNNTFLFVNWACVGLEFAALYSALVLSSDTSHKKTIFGVVGSIMTVYVANMVRLLFTGIVLSKDLLGPLVTSENTLEMSYFLSESVVSQIFVVVAAMGLFIVMRKYIPDIGRIIDGFLDLHPTIEAYLKEKTMKYVGDYL